MTYQEFLEIQYNIDKEKDYYCYVTARFHHSKEDEDKYKYYLMKSKKINEFKKRVLTQALKNIPKEYFK